MPPYPYPFQTTADTIAGVILIGAMVGALGFCWYMARRDRAVAKALQAEVNETERIAKGRRY